MNIGNRVQFLLPLLQSVLLCSFNLDTSKSNLSILLCKMMIAILAELQPIIEIIWHLLSCFIQVVKVVIVWVSALEILQPYRLSFCVCNEHIIDIVDALEPIKRIIFQKLIILDWVHDIASYNPFSTLIQHAACGLYPCTFLITEYLVLRATELAQDIHIIGWCL